MIATGPYWWYVNIGAVNGLVPSGNKQLSKPMSTRTEFNIAIWCHQNTFCGIMTPYNDIDLVQIGSGNEWLVAWRHQGCSALSHYLNKLKGRWFETSWTPFRYYKWLRLQWESVGVSLVQVMACRLFDAKPLPEPVRGPVIWNVMTAMLRHCNNNATKCYFGITNDYISSERVWRFALLLARTFSWTNSRGTGDWKHHDAHVASL